jgi:hypothetical protein
LFVHDCEQRHIQDLKENESNVWEIKLGNGGLPEDNIEVDFQIYEDNLEYEILRILRVLTKDYGIRD